MVVLITSDKVFCKVNGSWKNYIPPLPKVYAVDIAVNVADPYDRVSYPETVTINGQSYPNACYGYTPASGTTLNSWATDYDSGTGLISGIIPGTLNASTHEFTPASSKTVIPSGSSSADAMTYFPTWYQWWNNDGEYIHIVCCNQQLTSDFKDYPGSIGSERKGHFYLGCYTCNSSYQSQTGTPATIRYGDALNGCQARGTNYDMMTWFHYEYLAMLCVFIWKSTDLQNAFAGGYVGGSTVQSNTALSTTQYGMSGTSGYDTTNNMVFFWIEDLWGNSSQFIGGAHTTSTYELELNTGLSSTSSWDLRTNQSPNTTLVGYITKVFGSTEAGFFPLDDGGSTNSYFADQCTVYSNYFADVGGGPGNTTYAGPFYVEFRISESGYTRLVRLSYRG